jgi:thioredoxin reductase
MVGPWDEEADVVVVGYGGGGASAAIAAHDASARVLIIEKMTMAEIQNHVHLQRDEKLTAPRLLIGHSIRGRAQVVSPSLC